MPIVLVTKSLLSVADIIDIDGNTISGGVFGDEASVRGFNDLYLDGVMTSAISWPLPFCKW